MNTVGRPHTGVLAMASVIPDVEFGGTVLALWPDMHGHKNDVTPANICAKEMYLAGIPATMLALCPE